MVTPFTRTITGSITIRGSDKMVFITHGLDWAFRRPNISIQPPLKSLVGRALFQTSPGRKLFRERIGTLYTNVFRVPVILQRLNDALIEASLRRFESGRTGEARTERRAHG